MAKRFTDNEKWKKLFFKSLSTVNKLFFLYILDECDNAGIWHVEPEIAEIRIGETIDIELAKSELGKHIHEFDDGEKWFIPFFIDFQYGTLNPSVNAHKSVIEKLRKRKLTGIYEQFINCSLRDMDKDKDMDMDKNIIKDINTLWVRTFGRSPKIPEYEETEKFIEKYGYDVAYQTFKSAALRNIKSLSYLMSNIDSKGNLIPFEKKQSEHLITYEELLQLNIKDRNVFQKYEQVDSENGKKLWKLK